MPVPNRIRLLIASLVACALLHVAAFAQAPEQGLASWYGAPFDGQKAASGEIYHEEQLTAAHRTLPFGTTVRIRRVDTGASVVVRINDRGPYVESRIIDLSSAAAHRLHMVKPGVVPVALEIIGTVAADPRTLYAVQTGSFRFLANAERTLARLERQFGAARIVPKAEAGLWCVLVGAASLQADAEALADAIRKSKGLESAYVVRVARPAPPLTD
jgi:rare lipoprotein A